MKTKTYRISSSGIDLDIKKTEILRYLGYGKNLDDKNIDKEILEAVGELQKTTALNYIYRIFDFKVVDGTIDVTDTTLRIKSKDLLKHLRDSEKLAIMATTLGFQVEKHIKYLNKVDLSKGVIYEACAAALIEELCDYVENEIEAEATSDDFNITKRYSPGYGDLELDIQPKILKVVEAQKKIGINVTENFIMVPRKSVTALIGLKNK